ncbi:porin [Rhodobacteraceae bacterium 63075]|nr:porin [Rhodobacteraceae bacterium 63075]
MKKILFATTALVATASVAAADVTFSGYARFGILYNGSASSTDITSRLRLQIDATAESDAGVEFGARVRMQTNEGQSGVGMNHARFFARSGGLEVGVGNIYGALEFMPGQYPVDIGLTGHGYDYVAYNFRGDAYSSGGMGTGGSNGIEVMYSQGDFSAHVSASDVNDRIAAHGAYSWNGWTFALGLQDSNAAADTELTASVGGDIGPATVGFAWADNGTAGDHWVLSGRFDVGAATNVEAYIADADYFAETSYGVDFNHDLGGGTSLRGGVTSDQNGDTFADFGVRFNF